MKVKEAGVEGKAVVTDNRAWLRSCSVNSSVSPMVIYGEGMGSSVSLRSMSEMVSLADAVLGSRTPLIECVVRSQ